MTLYDLRGKEMYVGSQKIGKAYFNNKTVFGKPSLVFPDPPEYRLNSIRNAFFYGAGKEEVYAGSSNLTLQSDLTTMQSNGLKLNGGAILISPWLSSLHGQGVVEFTIENNFDHLSPGESEVIFTSIRPQNHSKEYTAVNLSVSKTTSGINQISDTGMSVDVPKDADFLHFSIQYMASLSGRNYSPIIGIHLNGQIFLLHTPTNRFGYPLAPDVYLEGNILIYDFKVYSPLSIAEMNETVTTNYNGIKDLPFVRTDQL